MREAGLIDRWRSHWWRPPTSCPSTHSGSARAMHMTSLTGIFLAVVALSLVALFVFTIEYSMFKSRRKSYITNWWSIVGWAYQHPLESNESTNQAFVHNFEMHLRLWGEIFQQNMKYREWAWQLHCRTIPNITWCAMSVDFELFETLYRCLISFPNMCISAGTSHDFMIESLYNLLYHKQSLIKYNKHLQCKSLMCKIKIKFLLH